MSFIEAIASMASFWSRLIGSWFNPELLDRDIVPDATRHPRNCYPGCSR
jgi:hypothetical protein